MARDPISRGYRQAKKIAHAVEHPDQWLEQQFLKTLPPAAREIYRALKHPPSPDQLVKRYLRSLVKRALKRELKALLKVRPRPRLISPALLEPKPAPLADVGLGGGEDRIITVRGPEGEATVVIQGMPSLQSIIATDKGCPGHSSPGILQETDADIMLEIKEWIEADFADFMGGDEEE
jgi:hypothetical protein